MSTVGTSGSGDGQFAFAGATAVNLASGDVYVVDQFGYRVERFDASGSFQGAFGWGVADGSAAAQTCSSNCQPGLPGSGDGQFDTPQGIAIDQSDGSVYVVDGNNNRIEKFDATGTYVSQFGSAGSAEGQFSGPQGIAVDPMDGSVYVADTGNNRIEKFDDTGAFVNTFGFGVSDGNSSFQTCTASCQTGLAVPDDGGFNTPTRVAVDSTGRIYVLDFGNGRVERYSAATAFDQVFDAPDVNINTFPFEIAVGPGNDHLYVAQAAPDFSEQRVFEIDAAGTLIDIHGVGAQVFNASGLALSAGSQKIYLADGFATRVLIMDDISPPDLTIDPAADLTATSASVSGSVIPNGDPPVGWHFEISTDDANWSATDADQDAGNGNTPVPVSQNLTGLIPNTHYFVRLVATRSLNAATYSSEIQLTTSAMPPDATTQQALDITPTQATVQGEVHPHHSPTTYHFEYGTSTAYGSSAPPEHDADAGSADTPATVYQRLGGLRPNTTYHYRLVATNQAGITPGDDRTFTTTAEPAASSPRPGIPGAGFLPDDRGWEKVSPEEKNGGDIMIDSGRTRMSIDGSAATLASLSAFGDAIGTGAATDYMSRRNPESGWTTHAITPRQKPLTLLPLARAVQPVYLGFSATLSRGTLLGWSPVTDDPDVANVSNMYLREDPQTPGAGAYQLISACPACASPLPGLPEVGLTGGGQPRFEGASADFGHVIFGSQEPLTSDAPACINILFPNSCPASLYEWDHGTVRLVGVLPDSACGTPPCPAHGSQAGQDSGASQGITELTPHAISADGSRIFFTVPTFQRSQSGQLYMRVDHSTTVQLNASERTPPVSGQPATYWDASTDGLRAFFVTPEALTDDAPADGDRKLYMYDASKPASDPHNLTLISADGEPSDSHDVANVQGVSRDGHYIYFASAGRLIAGQPPLSTSTDRALYVWHDGTLKFIANMHEFSDNNEDTTTTSWTLNQPTARVTPDGRHLLFSSSRPGPGLTGYDQGHCSSLDAGCREFYLYAFDSQKLECVSCNPSAAPATQGAFAAARVHTSAAVTSPTQNHPLTEDGKHVFFNTAEALIPEDVNGRIDVYEYDVSTGTVHLMSNGIDRSDSYFMDASPSGGDVLFMTRAQLVGSDHDSSYDLYDARVGGGFPEPPPNPPACTGDACQGPQRSVPDASTPGSTLTGSAPAHGPKAKAKSKRKRCRKGYVRKRVRGKIKCVKKHRARTRSHARGRVR